MQVRSHDEDQPSVWHKGYDTMVAPEGVVEKELKKRWELRGSLLTAHKMSVIALQDITGTSVTNPPTLQATGLVPFKGI